MRSSGTALFAGIGGRSSIVPPRPIGATRPAYRLGRRLRTTRVGVGLPSDENPGGHGWEGSKPCAAQSLRARWPSKPGTPLGHSPHLAPVVSEAHARLSPKLWPSRPSSHSGAPRPARPIPQGLREGTVHAGRAVGFARSIGGIEPFRGHSRMVPEPSVRGFQIVKNERSGGGRRGFIKGSLIWLDFKGNQRRD